MQDLSADAAPQAHHQADEGYAQDQLPEGAEARNELEVVAQPQPEHGAHEGPHERSDPAHDGLHHQLARGLQREGVRRHVALEGTQHRAGKARIEGRDGEGRELVGRHVVAEHGHARGVLLDRFQDEPDRRVHDAPGQNEAEEEGRREERVHG